MHRFDRSSNIIEEKGGFGSDQHKRKKLHPVSIFFYRFLTLSMSSHSKLYFHSNKVAVGLDNDKSVKITIIFIHLTIRLMFDCKSFRSKNMKELVKKIESNLVLTVLIG